MRTTAKSFLQNLQNKIQGVKIYTLFNIFKNFSYRERYEKMTSRKNTVLKAVMLILLTSSVLFAASCSNNNPDGNYILAEPDGGDYSYHYPVGWKELRSDSMFAIESPDGLANISSSWYPLSLAKVDLYALYGESEDPENELLSDYITKGIGENSIGYMAGLRENFGENIIFEGELQDVEVEGGVRPAKKLVYHMKVGDDEYFHETVFVLLPDDQERCFVYVLHYTSADETVKEQHRAVFDTVINTFKFTTLFGNNEEAQTEAPKTVA